MRPDTDEIAKWDEIARYGHEIPKGDSFLMDGAFADIHLSKDEKYGVHVYKQFFRDVPRQVRFKEYARQRDAREIVDSEDLGCPIVPAVFQHDRHGEGFCMDYAPHLLDEYQGFDKDNETARIIFITRGIMKILRGYEEGLVHGDLHTFNGFAQ